MYEYEQMPSCMLVNWMKSNHKIQARLKMSFHDGTGDVETKLHFISMHRINSPRILVSLLLFIIGCLPTESPVDMLDLCA